jgi:3-hydroxyisobutyrate dehydrogenase-like beta-hydroxyacid dehydrogenase
MLCPVTKEEFREFAKPLDVRLGEVPMLAMPKEFSTGSLGFYMGGKTTVLVNGKPCQAQIGLNVTIIGSKGAAQP